MKHKHWKFKEAPDGAFFRFRGEPFAVWKKAGESWAVMQFMRDHTRGGA